MSKSLPESDGLARCLNASGLDREQATRFRHALQRATAAARSPTIELDKHAELAAPAFAEGWSLIERLPLPTARNDVEKQAGKHLVESMAELCRLFCRIHRQAIYRKLTNNFDAVRVDELLWRAAVEWPGLVPTKAQVLAESKRKLADKDGLEIQQGVFASQLLSDAEIGRHLCLSMLRPTTEALGLLEEFQAKGTLDLGAVRLDAKDGAGTITFHHPRFLNAEDDSTIGPLEVAIDLVLLHPGLSMGVLRGGEVDHPKYKGRRVFSSGINLTQIYYGQLSYLFYLLRDLGPVNKLFRGLVTSSVEGQEPETTMEKLWLAVVEAFAIGGGCQLLLVVDYVIAEEGSYFSLPARKEGIIPGAANLRLPRFVGERAAQHAILFDKKFPVESDQAATIINEVHPTRDIDHTVERAVSNAVGSGMVSAGGNRKAMRVGSESLDTFRSYMATYAAEQARCHLSDQLVENLEKFWGAESRRT